MKWDSCLDESLLGEYRAKLRLGVMVSKRRVRAKDSYGRNVPCRCIEIPPLPIKGNVFDHLRVKGILARGTNRLIECETLAHARLIFRDVSERGIAVGARHLVSADERDKPPIRQIFRVVLGLRSRRPACVAGDAVGRLLLSTRCCLRRCRYS